MCIIWNTGKSDTGPRATNPACTILSGYVRYTHRARNALLERSEISHIRVQGKHHCGDGPIFTDHKIERGARVLRGQDF